MTTLTMTALAAGKLENHLPMQLKTEDSVSNEVGGEGGGLIENLWTLPHFTDKMEERIWAKNHMAGAFRVIAKLGMNDGAGGHISLRDPVRPDCFWINPYRVHFGMVNACDLILVTEDGVPVLPTKYKVNTAGFRIHAAVHKARPDINAAVHTHSPYGRAWSTFGRSIEMLNQDSCFFYNDLAVYQGFGGVVLGQEEGDRIAASLGPSKKNVIMRNHGILTSGGTVDEAIAYFIALERACQTQLLVEAAAANGVPKTFVGEEEAAFTKKAAGTPAVLFAQFQPEYEMIVKETGGDFLEHIRFETHLVIPS